MLHVDRLVADDTRSFLSIFWKAGTYVIYIHMYSLEIEDSSLKLHVRIAKVVVYAIIASK